MDTNLAQRPTSRTKRSAPSKNRRVQATMDAAASLIEGKKEMRLSWRANERLVRAAQAKSGLEGSELLEYALAKVALEDDYIQTLLSLRGTVHRDIDLEF